MLKVTEARAAEASLSQMVKVPMSHVNTSMLSMIVMVKSAVPSYTVSSNCPSLHAIQKHTHVKREDMQRL